MVTEEALDGQLRPYLDTVTQTSISLETLNVYYEQIILGKVVSRKAKMDLGLAKNLVLAGNQFEGYMTVLGKTISTDDFYEGQGRLDGAICEYKEEDKMNYLRDVASQGVKNMEMEALVFGALTHMAGVRSAVVCVTLLDRLKGDQVSVQLIEQLQK